MDALNHDSHVSSFVRPSLWIAICIVALLTIGTACLGGLSEFGLLGCPEKAYANTLAAVQPQSGAKVYSGKVRKAGWYDISALDRNKSLLSCGKVTRRTGWKWPSAAYRERYVNPSFKLAGKITVWTNKVTFSPGPSLSRVVSLVNKRTLSPKAFLGSAKKTLRTWGDVRVRVRGGKVVAAVLIPVSSIECYS